MALWAASPAGAAPEDAEAMDLPLAGVALEACGAVFLTGLPASDFLSHSGLFWIGARGTVAPPIVDRRRGRVTVRAEGRSRTATHVRGQGCTLADDLPPASREPVAPSTGADWTVSRERLPASAAAAIDRAVARAFSDPAARTSAVLVVHRGAIVAERYAPGITATTPLAGWSMTKTVQAALVGLLAGEGLIRLRDPVPIEEWTGDDRRSIRWLDLLRMSGGLRCSDGRGYDARRWHAEGYPDHLAAVVQPDTFAWALARPAEFPAGRIGRYRNCDTVALSAAIDRVLRRHGRSFAAWPRAALYEPIGMTSMTVSSDARGNPVMTGFGHATARDWGRFGQFLLQDGTWNGERLLDADFMDMLRAPAPAWVAAGTPDYAGQLWLARSRLDDPELPEDSYAMLGIDGQAMWIIPSHDLVVLRLGFGGGTPPGQPIAFSRMEGRFLREIVNSVRPEGPVGQEAAIRAVLAGYFGALERGDRAAAARLTTGDFLLYDAGEVMTNDVLFDRLAAVRQAYPELRWILSNLVVEAAGDLATIRYRSEGWRLGADGQLQTPQWLESAHLVRTADGWKLRFLHSSRKN
ncbi:serine hydrolase [Sphingosinicella sp. LHD-64]|uniref:serine hydrolase n=1 Tax=Sphingosinicella sp. LHD-64 TaxID=3072139 RepID=UPI00280DB51E|nr:serine hydrolase [Sphingosinicella sp. LHD-64]MDQ8758152.1 serine hydrolase [Sphingosinicella sp. LHD-64]